MPVMCQTLNLFRRTDVSSIPIWILCKELQRGPSHGELQLPLLGACFPHLAGAKICLCGLRIPPSATRQLSVRLSSPRCELFISMPPPATYALLISVNRVVFTIVQPPLNDDVR